MSYPVYVGAIVGAAYAIRRKKLIQRFQAAGATSSATAIDLTSLQTESSALLRSLLKRGIVRQEGTDRYYLDEPAWADFRERQRVAGITVCVVFGVLILVLLLVVASK